MTEGRKGLFFGAAAYLIWGVFPVYWPLLKPAGALEILGHRMAWSLVVAVIVVSVQRLWRPIRALPRRKVGLLAAAAVLIGINWGTYIWAVNHHHVVETSLGYFINPLVTVLFGVTFLRERLRRPQWIAVGLGAVAIVVIAVDYGRPPWIALVLALTFGTYGLVKKYVGIGAVESFTVETATLFVPAVIYLVALGSAGDATFGRHGVGQALLLAATGVITAVPLLCFGAAARRLPLVTLGLLQYLAPILQFLFGVLFFHEPLPAARLVGFVLVWAALVVLSVDAVRNQRASRSLAAVS